ncbi:MAG: tetratricopeptide repeat protein [Deltaproteobacteria bacterium]|nr:tetratricopeptide repeat protein [Deltaproteobacteria bacterium]
MSAIFQTLKRLRTSTRDEEERRSRLKRCRNIYSFRRVLLSPLGALAVVALLIIAGLVASYAAGSLSDYFPHKHKPPVLPEAETTLVSGVDRSLEDETSKRGEVIHQASETGHKKTRDEDLPESPGGIPVEEIEPGIRPMPPLHLKESDPPDARGAKYLPPRFQMPPEMPPGEIERTARQRPLPSEQVLADHEHGEAALDLSGSKTPKAPPELLSEGFLSPGAPRVDEVQASYIPPSDEYQVNAALDKGAMKKTMERTHPSQPGPVPFGLISADNKEASGSTEVLTSRAERIHPADVGKAQKINRLVSKIEKSMTIGDIDDAKARIDELAVLKGEQSSYVLKLRAFWHMRQGDFEAPVSLLTAVLAQEQNDLEAGINMAIVEIKTHRLDKARKRLAKLREVYPANTIIEDIIQKMGR